MSNPDTSGSSMDALLSASPVAILFLLITILLFQFKNSIQYFKLVLWVALPIITIIITFGVNVIAQYISCRTTNIGKALLGSLPSAVAILMGLGIATISYCRIPVTSFFAPLILGSIDVTKNKSTININSIKNSNSKACCIPKLTLESIESKYPLITGLSYGFYVMFSILFGMVIGTGISSVC